MVAVERIAPEQRMKHAPLFANLPGMHTAAASVLESRCGDLFVDAAGARTGWIHVSPFWLLGGVHTGEGADEAIEAVARFGGVVVAEQSWVDVIEHRYQDRVERSTRTPFSAANLSPERARELSASVDQRGIIVERMDAAAIATAAERISPDLLFRASFSTPAAFEEAGIGYWALKDGEPLAAATSALVSEYAIEIQVNTSAEHRRQGLGICVSAALIAECLEHGVTPNWDTESPVSARLAERLGYTPLPSYDVITVNPTRRP